jgi:hypothetical protein
MTVGNGAQVVLNTTYNFNGGAAQTIMSWPYLSPVSPGSPVGQVDIFVSSCTPPGVYNFTQIQNSENGVWLPTNASVTINPAGPPSVASVTPSGGMQGTSVMVTITGTNLCGVPPSTMLSTTWPGLTFSNVSVDSTGNTVSATFDISPTASVGNAPVKVTGGGGSANFSFTIKSSTGLTKEYIYLGSRIIATEAP